MGQVISRLIWIMVLCLVLSSTACQSDPDPTAKPKKRKGVKKLTLLTLTRIKNTGYLHHIVPLFEKDYGVQVQIITVEGSDELLQNLQREKDSQKYDIVVGIDNCMFTDQTAFDGMFKTKTLRRYPVNNSFQFDPQARLVPYGFGYLTMLYNEQKISEPPTSFGEMQDSRFYDQIVVCDPHKSGVGRAVLYWTLSLFGNEGYQQFWKSIKKNTYKNKESWQDALFCLNSQECGMAFGFTSTPAWLLETQASPLPIKASLLKEGSFLYVEAAGINRESKHKPLAEAFLSHMMSPEVQRFVAYDMGLFPANESTPLPAHFSSTPFTSFALNEKLAAEDPATNLKGWLSFWDKLFSQSFY